ncbi:MAG: hypothetical protein JNJ52_01520 [Flavobacterium sp.]|nr:hypothetical protein [Flavobacterium sp.]
MFEQKRFKEAQNGIMEVLATEPENIQCLILLVEIKIEKDEFDEALKIVDNAIGIQPDYDVLYYIKSRVLVNLEKTNEALSCINEAIRLDPYDADNHAFLGFIYNQKKQFEDALASANEALSIDGAHVFALNVRSTALLKLNRKNESFETIEGALYENPNNAFTHANYGWGLLEKGNSDKALMHFRESLKNDPNFEYAQSGMAEALKSKYLIYKWFLKYSFWISNQTSKNQWVFIIVFYFGTKFLRSLANSNTALSPFLMPIIVLLTLFAFSTWVITPLVNLLFRLNKYGKHLLTKQEIKSSNSVGVSVIVLIIGLLTMFFDDTIGASIAIFGFTMMLPLSNQFQKPRFFFFGYTLLMMVLGFGAVFLVVKDGELFNGISMLYLVSFIAYQWIANYFIINRNY